MVTHVKIFILPVFLFLIFPIHVLAANDIYIDSCSVLSVQGGQYVLTADLAGDQVAANCLNVAAPDVTVDCQGHSIINHNLKSALIFSNQARTTIKNCVLESYLGTQYIEYEISLGIYFKGSSGLIKNNVIRHTGSGIYVTGNANIIDGNHVENTIKAIRLRNNNNIAKNNLTKNNRNAQGWGLEVWKGTGSQFINNKSYGNDYGLLLAYADNTAVRCGEISGNVVKDAYLYYGSNNVSFQGTLPAKRYVSPDSDMTYTEDVCSDVDCQWQGDTCVPVNSEITINYIYDDLNRLEEVDYPVKTIRYDYDEVGNMDKKSIY
jgi:hypothetical protein